MGRHPLIKLLSLTLITVIGCTSGDDGKIEGFEPNTLSLPILTFTATTLPDGIATIPFQIPQGATAFSLTAFSSEEKNLLTFFELIGPNGAPLTTSAAIATTTGQNVFNRSPITVNFPASPSALGALQPGLYTIRILVQKSNSSAISNALIRLTVTIKSDSGNFKGRAKLNVNAILTGAVADDERNRISIEAALSKTQEIFADRGIDLAVKLHRRGDLPSQLSNPFDDDSSANFIYENTSNEFPFAINLFFGVDANSLNFPDNEFAQGGYTPISATPSSRSAIVFSLRQLAGSDGEFDKDRDENDLDFQEFDDETLQMTGVIAHELGHALGLSNSVTLRGEEAIGSDTLSDTQSCIDKSNCESERDVNRNIMFPYTLKKRGSGNKFWPRDSISEQQAIVIKQNVLVHVE